MKLTRREMLRGGLSALGFLALPGGLWAAPAGWKLKKRPILVFGVLADTHMRCHYDGKSFYSHNGACFGDHALVTVMKHFKAEGVDAILHCGDVTDRGMVREMEFYKEAWDKVYGGAPRPANLIVTGNHDVENAFSFWAKGVAHSEDPAVFNKLRLGPNLKAAMERIWGEPYEDVWHKEVKGYHFFGFAWPYLRGKERSEAFPYEGRLYHDTSYEGKKYVKYVHNGLWMAELIRREREAGRLDPQKPFFTAMHELWFPILTIDGALRSALGLKEGELCNGLGFHGHGHGSDAHWRFNWWGDSLCHPHLMCSTLAYWKGHGGEGENPLFAKGFGSGRIDVENTDINMADHALLVRVYDDMMTISRVWVSVKPKPVIGSLGPDWVMPLSGFTPNDHPLKMENYVKVIGSPEFPRGAKLEVSKTETVLRIKIPKADGNPDSRSYGFNVVVAGEDGTKVRKNCYARGYCMGVGYEPNNGITEVEIPASELPAGKKLTIAVRPVSSLGTKGKTIGTTWKT